ncbi:hypothetical protein D3C75_1256330 [compost metagenome]
MQRRIGPFPIDFAAITHGTDLELIFLTGETEYTAVPMNPLLKVCITFFYPDERTR